MKVKRRRQSGFALLLTLVLLMIAAVALSHTARLSAGEALHALEQSEQLQRRWAVASLRETLLPRAAGLLAEASAVPVDENGDPILGPNRALPGTDLRVRCELAGLGYDLVFTDEQAKFNPTIFAALQHDDRPLFNKRQLRSTIQELTGLGPRGVRAGEGSVVLRPMIGRDARGEVIESSGDEDEDLDQREAEAYSGFGQLFKGVGPAALVGDGDRPGVADQVTCWGDGRLNLRRAPDAVVKRALTPLLGAEGVEQLIEVRRASPEQTLAKWLARITDADPKGLGLASALLTTRSNAEGLWIVAHGPTRSWYTFSTRVYTPPTEPDDTQTTDPLADAPVDEDAGEQEDVPDPLQRYDYAW